jgi:hypothetical protein
VAKHISIALIVGFGVSAMLGLSMYATHLWLLISPQFPGWWACVAFPTTQDFFSIAVPVNGALYSVLIFLGLRAFRPAPSKRRFSWILHGFIAVVVGTCLAGFLLFLSRDVYSAFLFVVQYAGFRTCVALHGAHPLTRMDLEHIVLPVNASVYAAIIFLSLRAFRRLAPKWTGINFRPNVKAAAKRVSAPTPPQPKLPSTQLQPKPQLQAKAPPPGPQPQPKKGEINYRPNVKVPGGGRFRPN